MRKLLVAAVAAAAVLIPASSALAAPSNDDRANATVVSSLPYMVSEDVSGATKDDPTLSGWPQVWFRYTPTRDVSLELDASGSNVQTQACVWIGYSQQSCSGDGFDAHLLATLKAGTTYDLELRLSGCCPDPPTLKLSLVDRSVANDDIAGATKVGSLPYQDFADTARATTAPDDPWCQQYSYASVWYSYTPSVAQTVRLKTYGSDWSPYVCAFTGARGALTQVAGGYAELQVSLQAGTTYWFGAFANGSDHQHLTFSLADVAATPAVANDEVAGASQLKGSSIYLEQDVTQATAAGDDPSCYGRNGSVWYTFTATASGTATFSTGGDYDARGSVWTGAPGSLTPVGGDASDCYAQGDHQLSFPVEAGVRYTLLVNAPWGAAPGHLALSGTLPAPPLTVAVMLAPKGAVDRSTGVATVGGVATCNRAVTLTVQVVVRQGKAFGGGTGTASCKPGSYAPFVVEAKPSGKGTVVPFVAGDADVTADASGCDDISCGGAAAAATVKLVRR